MTTDHERSDQASNDADATDDDISMIDHIGGRTALREWIRIFHKSVIEDPLLGEMFNYGKPTHELHLTDFYEEVMGGRMLYTERHRGVEGLFDAHENLCITEEQRARFVELMIASADDAGLPNDDRFRSALRQRIEDGSGFSHRLSQPGAERYDPWPPVGVFDW